MSIKLRELITPARYRYQRYALACERCDEELRLILAGERATCTRLNRLLRERDEAWRELQPYLREITARTRRRDPGDDLLPWLQTKAQAIARDGARLPINTLKTKVM